MKIHNLVLAEEFLLLSKTMCDWDPQLENELGVCYYKREKYTLSIQQFEHVIRVLGEKQSKQLVWVSVWNNLAQAYMRIK